MSRRKQDKAFLHLYIDKNVLAKAKELIPNLSEFVETKLREYIILAEHGLVQNEWARRDSNPRPPPREGGVITPRPRALKIISQCC